MLFHQCSAELAGRNLHKANLVTFRLWCRLSLLGIAALMAARCCALVPSFSCRYLASAGPRAQVAQHIVPAAACRVTRGGVSVQLRKLQRQAREVRDCEMRLQPDRLSKNATDSSATYDVSNKTLAVACPQQERSVTYKPRPQSCRER